MHNYYKFRPYLTGNTLRLGVTTFREITAIYCENDIMHIAPPHRSRDSSVGIATGHRLGDRGVGDIATGRNFKGKDYITK
jgi:hypothetical protein